MLTARFPVVDNSIGGAVARPEGLQCVVWAKNRRVSECEAGG